MSINNRPRADLSKEKNIVDIPVSIGGSLEEYDAPTLKINASYRSDYEAGAVGLGQRMGADEPSFKVEFAEPHECLTDGEVTDPSVYISKMESNYNCHQKYGGQRILVKILPEIFLETSPSAVEELKEVDTDGTDRLPDSEVDGSVDMGDIDSFNVDIR